MPTFDPARFLRQVLLPEIGAPGQSRLCAGTARVGGEGLAHEVARRYALAAGFARAELGPIDQASLAPLDVCTEDAPRAVLAGSRAALAEIRRTLQSPPGSAPEGAS